MFIYTSYSLRAMPKTKTAAQDDWTFGLSLLAYLGEGNVSFSPTSIRTALAMLCEGATGKTAQQITNATGIPRNASARRELFAKYVRMLNAADAEYVLRCANALWTNCKNPIRDEFKKTLKSSYAAEAQEADFQTNPDGECDKINKWVAKKTEKKISELFPKKSLSKDTILVLANALYFKAEWDNKFNKKYTQNQQFTLSDGSLVDVSMMRKGSVDSPYALPKFLYGEFDGVQVAKLPYKGKQLATIAFLPPKGTSVVDLEAQLRAGNPNLTQIQSMLKQQSFIRLEMPKHELKGNYDLNTALTEVGIDRIFSPETAELSGIVDRQLYVNSVKHKTYFKTDEKGSEGAAATSVGFSATTAIVKQIYIEFVADRPFLEAIVHQPTGVCLFINRVENPQ